MINDQNAIQTISFSPAAHPSRTRYGRGRLAPLAAALRRMAAALTAVARGGVRPHAALWEASVVLSLIQEREEFEPDPFGTEMPFLSDSWPRG
jgi:hypothetical protein